MATKRVVLATVAAVIAGSAASAAHAGPSPTPLPRSFCTPVTSGSEAPQVLIASDLPVKGFEQRATTLQMAAAIRFVLARHHYRAGRLSVGYQACDDAGPASSSGDVAKCVANAKAYAQNAAVVGVVGTWSSHCAGVEIPILEQAPNGPLGLVSPSNTNVGLTHADAGTAPGEPRSYYPTGTRNFVRVISADDAQARADALLATRLGAQRVFVLDDGTGYGLSVAESFRAAARKLHFRVVGTGAWNPAAAQFPELIRSVRASRPDAVFLGGSGCPGCGTLLRQLRAIVGPAGTLIAPDGFSPATDVARAFGSAAEGLYVSVPGESLSDLSPLGRTIARRFGPYHLGSGGPAYAAQAVEVLLAAIAASDGSRSSVTQRLFTTRVHGGILGSFGFDRNGDTTLNPVLVYRVHGRAGRFDRVVHAPAP